MQIISIKNVSKEYGNCKVLNNLSLEIKKGSIQFIIGLNGAGKTTLLKSLLHQISISSGFIEIENNSVLAASLEIPTFYEYMTAYENLMYKSIRKGYDTKNISNVLNYVGLSDINKKPVRKYSLGMRQRLKIAEVILGNPDVIIFDEPFNGLDPEGIYHIKRILRSLNQELGVTIILSSHLIKETEQIATDYAIIHNGSILSQFHCSELRQKLKCVDITGVSYDEMMNFIQRKMNKEIIVFGAEEKLRCFSLSSYSEHDNLLQFKRSFSENYKNAIISEMRDGNLDEYFLALTREGALC